MYRWVDEKGNVFYSGQVPPDQVKHRRESLNENARVIDVLEKHKTKAQRELEKRLIVLRRQQEKIIARQRTQDKVLLATYRTLNDMRLTLKSKMMSLDGKKRVIQGNLERFEQQLLQQQKRAAQFERDGRKVPKPLLDNITSTKSQIEISMAEVVKQISNKKLVKENFEKDMVRFAYLTQPNITSKLLSLKTAENIAENELGLFICKSLVQCDRAWGIAKQFVLDFSSSVLDIETDRLIMSQAPYTDNDLSLSVSKMDVTKTKQQLFLDIRCRRSSVGSELCNGGKAKKIRHSFSDYIKSALAIDLKEVDIPSAE